MSLEECGYATSVNDKKVAFIPDKNIVDNVVQKIRAELLEEGGLSSKTIALVCLLNKSKDLKQYFSKYEEKQLKTRLKEIEKNPTNQFIKKIIDYIDAIFISMTACFIASN